MAFRSTVLHRRDILGVVVFLMIFTAVVFFIAGNGHTSLEYNNFIPADPLKTRRTSHRSGTSRCTTRSLRAVPPLFCLQFQASLRWARRR